MSLTKQLFSRMWMHVQNKFDEMVGNKPVSEQIEEAVEGISPADIGAQPAGDYALNSSIPTKVSDLTNDAGYLTEHQDLTAYATKTYADNAVSTHNTNASAHNDIRDLISGLSTRLNALADSDDTTLDQMSEIVAYIKANKSLIDSVTTSKVNTADIVNNLTTNVATKPLSAAQGVALKALVDGKAAKSDLTGLATQDYVNAQIQAAVANLLTREQMVEYVETSILGGEW